MKKVTVTILVFASVFLQGLVTTVPISLAVVLPAYVLRRDGFVLVLSFMLGVVLDVLTLGTIGATSLFFLGFCLLVTLYERKFEIASLPFVAIVAFVGSVAYTLLFGHDSLLMAAPLSGVATLFAVLLFKLSIRKAESI